MAYFWRQNEAALKREAPVAGTTRPPLTNNFFHYPEQGDQPPNQDDVRPDDPRYVPAELRRDAQARFFHGPRTVNRESREKLDYIKDHLHGTTAAVAEDEADSVDGRGGNMEKNSIHRAARDHVAMHRDHLHGTTAAVAEDEADSVDGGKMEKNSINRAARDQTAQDRVGGIVFGNGAEGPFDPLTGTSSRRPYRAARPVADAAGQVSRPAGAFRYAHEDGRREHGKRCLGLNSPENHLGGQGAEVVREQEPAKKMLSPAGSAYDEEAHNVPVGGFDHIKAGVERLKRPYFSEQRQKVVYPNDELGFDNVIGHGKRHGYAERGVASAGVHFRGGTMAPGGDLDWGEEKRGKMQVQHRKDHIQADDFGHLRKSVGEIEREEGLLTGGHKHHSAHEADHYDGMVFLDDEPSQSPRARNKAPVPSHPVDGLNDDFSPTATGSFERAHGRKHIVAVSADGMIGGAGIFAEGGGAAGAAGAGPEQRTSVGIRITRNERKYDHVGDVLENKNAVVHPHVHVMQHYTPNAVGRQHVRQVDSVKAHAFARQQSYLAAQLGEEAGGKPVTGEEMRAAVTAEIEQQADLAIEHPRKWEQCMVCKKGAKWEISAVDIYGNTISREGVAPDQLALAFCGLNHQEMRLFGLRAVVDFPIVKPERKSRESAYQASNGMSRALTLMGRENEALNRKFLDRASVQDGSRMGVVNDRTEEYEFNFDNRGRKHYFDQIARHDHFAQGLEFKEEAADGRGQRSMGSAAGFVPETFFDGFGRKKRIEASGMRHLHLTGDWRWSSEGDDEDSKKKGRKRVFLRGTTNAQIDHIAADMGTKEGVKLIDATGGQHLHHVEGARRQTMDNW